MKSILLHLLAIAFLFINQRSFCQIVNLDSLILDEMSDAHSPGLSALILKKGYPVWVNAYGYAHLDDSTLVTPATVFMLASISKTITATAIMNVFENGGFALEDDINGYLPFSVSNPNYPDDTITFQQLLTHTSSIKDNWQVLGSVYSDGDSPIPLGEFLKDYLVPGGQYYDAAKNFYTYAPETKYNYCNEAVALCGYLVETITGVPFDQYCNDSIFTPLCMNQTSWFLAGLDTSNVAMPYFWQSGSYHAAGYYGYPDYPDGQLRTNAIALARFLDMYMHHGKHNDVRVLDSSTVALMLSIQFPQIENTQGLVWYKVTIGGRSCWGHNGGDTGVSTNMYFSPDDSTGIILLSNGGNFYSNTVMDAMFDYAESLEPLPGDTFTCGFYTSIDPTGTLVNPVTIYPNPSDGIFYIKIYEPPSINISLEVYDLQGKFILHENIAAGESKINISRQPAGTYLLRLRDGKMEKWGKLVKG